MFNYWANSRVVEIMGAVYADMEWKDPFPMFFTYDMERDEVSLNVMQFGNEVVVWIVHSSELSTQLTACRTRRFILEEAKKQGVDTTGWKHVLYTDNYTVHWKEDVFAIQDGDIEITGTMQCVKTGAGEHQYVMDDKTVTFGLSHPWLLQEPMFKRAFEITYGKKGEVK